MQGTFQLVVDVFDHTFNNPRWIDAIFFEPDPFMVQDRITGIYSSNGFYQVSAVSLQLSFNVECSDNYYDRDCATYCVPTDTYSCGSDGERVCSEDYYGSQCNVQCVSRDDELGHFNCDSNGTRLCLDGYYGADCIVYCQEEEYYQCDPESGERVCVEGFTSMDANCTTRKSTLHCMVVWFMFILIIYSKAHIFSLFTE